ARSRSLAGRPGAMAVEAQEAAERQATVDQASLQLAERKLSALYGRNAPWKDDYASPELTTLARGESKLVRVTFPLGALGASMPKTLRLAHMAESLGGRSFESAIVWSAPADTSLPGRSFFALLEGSDGREGDGLRAGAPGGGAGAGWVLAYR